MKQRMMKQRFLAWVLAAALSVPGLAMAQSAMKPEMTVPMHRSELLVLPEDVEEVAVADPNVADVAVHGSRRISVIGKELGKTDLRVFDGKGNLLIESAVNVTYDVAEIRRVVKGLFPNENVGIELVNNNIAITGAVSDAETSSKVVRVVEEFMSNDRVGDQDQTKVINLLQVRSGQQVMLRVRVGELQRTAAKAVGINLDAVKNVGSFGFILDGTAVASGNSTLQVGFNSGEASLTGVLDALENEGLLKILAEPNLVSMSGERAEFLAGGEFPIRVLQGNGAVSVQFREYGIGVQFTPYVLTANRLRLIVQPEVSSIDRAVALEDGTPGLVSRRVKTTIEMAPGESFMIAGLIQDQIETKVNEIPGVSEVPVLGALFRNTRTDKTERELVIAVTPYLVDPTASGDIRLPTDDFRPASIMESFFYGALGSLHGDAMRISQTPRVEGPVGFMVD
ncbi:hypothetical protein GC177_02060 [bacterium]|nr:hypothetical protein [bacterium]